MSNPTVNKPVPNGSMPAQLRGIKQAQSRNMPNQSGNSRDETRNISDPSRSTQNHDGMVPGRRSGGWEGEGGKGGGGVGRVSPVGYYQYGYRHDEDTPYYTFGYIGGE
jgi:hypothetical protein